MHRPADLRPAPVAGALGTVLSAAMLSLALWPAPAGVDGLTAVARTVGEVRERPERAELTVPATAAPVAPAPASAPARAQTTAPAAPKPADDDPADKPAAPVAVGKAPAPVAAKPPAPAPAPAPPPPAPAPAPPSPAPAPAPPAGPSSGEYEDRLVTAVNGERRARGLAPLQRDGCADGFARKQAGRMAAAGSIYHQDLNPVLDTCGGSRAAENVGYGDISPERMVELWMASASHRKQVLEPALTHLGSGAVLRDDGRWYAAHVFIGR